MSKQAADADRSAAEYWRSVARVDRTQAGAAVETARTLSADARREERNPQDTEAKRRSRGARTG